ncbi:MAG: D-alanyl-D-alanine carboxypeptidase family protein [Pseudomonadota bacterium]
MTARQLPLGAFVLALIVALLAALPARAQSQGTPARAAFVVDLTSGAVLLEKNPDRPLPPASMSKLMTLLMAFEALEQGRISMTDTFRTSKRASEMGGSKMFLREGGLVSVEDLIRGVIVQSGNDAAVAIAEALAGTEEAFAERMTQRGRDLGLEGSTFANSTGWPDPRQLMTVRDLAELARLLIERFPQYYPMFAETDFTWDGVAQKNRNPLLNLGVGADGLKTGHTQEAGYGLVASAIRGKRRIVMVISGLESKGERRHEAERLINWAFRAFDTRQLYAAGEGIIDAPVWIGSSATVTLAPERDVMVTAPFGTLDKAELKIRYEGPVPAPINEGQQIGHVEIEVPELPPVKVPLVAKHGVETGGFLTRMQAAGKLLLQPLFPG